MPPAGASSRAEQRAALAAIVHERATNPYFGDLIARCEEDSTLSGDAGSAEAANIREFRREYDKRTKLPGDLVKALARTGSESQQAWKGAREASDFAMFAPWLEKMVDLARRKAECLGAPEGGELYDALLDIYEPRATAKEVEAIFTPLRDRLSGLVADLLDKGRAPARDPIDITVGTAQQHELGQFVLKSLGFDMNAGRLDVTTHPFCSGMAPGDTRLTTRYREHAFTDALYGTMHEGGHGLYEQGLPKLGVNGMSRFGQPLGDSISLGIHESQSRLWENLVGRSHAFVEWLLPHARRFFSAGGASPLDSVGVDDLYGAVNQVERSYIRVESDEVTYNLHVMLRFEIERSIISGDLSVRDVPGAWNETFERLLGVPVPDDRRGCLQDVHWSFGLMGYFPTYCLGNLYAAQLWESVKREISDLDDQIRRGEFLPLLEWMRKNVHQHGKRYSAGELCERVTGAPLSADPLLRHLEGKFRPLYGV